MRLLHRKRDLAEKLCEFSKRGDLKAVASKIVQAGEEGKLSDKVVLKTRRVQLGTTSTGMLVQRFKKSPCSLTFQEPK